MNSVFLVLFTIVYFTNCVKCVRNEHQCVIRKPGSGMAQTQVWFLYIKQLLFSYLQKTTAAVIHMLKLLHNVFQVSFCFVQYRKVVDNENWTGISKATGILERKYDTSSFQTVETHINRDKTTFFQKIWKMQPAKQVAMNMTFHEIYFSTAIGGCYRAALEIFITDSNKFRRNLFQFCGFYSEVVVYLNHNNFGIEIFLLHNVLYSFKLSFAVFSRFIQYTHRSSSHGEGITNPTIHHTLCLAQHVQSYFHIKVRKDKRLNVYVTHHEQMNVTFYDGPGLWSETRSAHSHRGFISSTFQCMLVATLPLGSSPEDPAKLVRVLLSELKSHQSKVVLQSAVMSLPNKHCGINSCFVNLYTAPKLKLNVTVTQIVSSPNDADGRICTHSGFLTIQTSEDKFKESVVLCTNHSSVVEQSRSFYSTGPVLSIVLYWYKHHSSIHTTLNISRTTCHAATINLCRMMYMHDTQNYEANKKYIVTFAHIIFLPKSTHRPIGKVKSFFFNFVLRKPCVVLSSDDQELLSEPQFCYYINKPHLYMELKSFGFTEVNSLKSKDE